MLANRIKDLRQALKLEQQAELDRFRSLMEEQAIETRIREGITYYPIEHQSEEYNQFEELIVEFKINPEQSGREFGTNGKVILFNGHDSEEEEGIITRIKTDTLTLKLQSGELPDWLKKGKLGLNAVPDTRTYDTQLKALDKIEADELRLPHLFYQPEKLPQYTVEQTNPDGLNPAQSEAVDHLCSSNTFHLVHGPPGTGKTKTLVAAIAQLIEDGKRVIVAAPSNAAVDHITAQISQYEPRVLRMGNSFKIREDILPFTLQNKVLEHPLMNVVKRLKKESETVRKKAFKYKRVFDKEAYNERKQLRTELKSIRRDIRKTEHDITELCLENAPVITGTFMALQHEALKHWPADVVFVDEAGQALEPAIWTVAHLAPRLVMAGDPLQLPPSLFSNQAKALGLGRSLLEIGMEIGISTTLLNIQYRMNDQIMQFSNRIFYEDKLQSDATVAEKKLPSDPYTPLEFIDTAGCDYEEVNDDNGGIANPKEIELIGKRLKEIDLGSHNIGFISPYRKQVLALQEALPELAKHCQTIDSFQGQERDIIIVSMVRSNPDGIIGFLTDYRRMNVAMTRAKLKLILIGDSATLGGDSFYQKLLDYIEENNAYRSAWEYSY